MKTTTAVCTALAAALLAALCGCDNAYVRAHPELSKELRDAINNRRVMAGMTKEQVIASVGQPARRTTMPRVYEIESPDGVIKPFGFMPGARERIVPMKAPDGTTILKHIVIEEGDVLGPDENPQEQVWFWYVDVYDNKWEPYREQRYGRNSFGFSYGPRRTGMTTEYAACFKGDIVTGVSEKDGLKSPIGGFYELPRTPALLNLKR